MAKYWAISFFLALFLGFIAPVQGRAEECSKEWLIARFSQMDQAIHQGKGYAGFTNEGGLLAWSAGYLLDAYLEMYAGTGKRQWLDKFVEQSQHILKASDRARNLKDYRGRSLVGWSAQKYTQPRGHRQDHDPRVVQWVHTGMIVYPLAKFAWLVKNDPQLASYRSQAEMLRQASEEAVAVFNASWRFDPRTGKGYFVMDADDPASANAPKCKGRCMFAMNGDLAIGRVMILLYRLTGKQEYYQKAKALAVNFKDNLTLSGKKYVWQYRYKDDPLGNKRREDLSHGATDVGFAYWAQEAGIVFTREDLLRFAQTLIHASKGGDFAQYVDGSGPLTEGGSAGRWLDLSTVDCQAYQTVMTYLCNRLQRSNQEHPGVMLGVAKLIKYYDTCQKTKGKPRP